LFTSPPGRFHVRELARRTRLRLSTVQQELHNLALLGLVVSSSNGYHRHYSASGVHPLSKLVARLVATSERLRSIDPRATYRNAHRRRKRRTPRRRDLTPNRPPSWGIFTKPKQLDRFNRSSR
jgi:hypothetical protein